MGETTPQLRVGDRERREVDDRLMAAVGDGVLTLGEYDERSGALWQARTRAELDALVADLPAAAPPVRAVARGRTEPGRVVAVMSEDRFAGALVPGQQVTGTALMGKAVLDLRREDLPDGTRVTVRSVMGQVEVLVPPGTVVELSGLSVMGERKVEVAAGSGPVVHVDALAVMGSVTVGTGDGSVVAAGGRRTSAEPEQRASSVAVRHGAEVHGAAGHLSRVVGRAKALLVPAALVGGILLAGPDARSVFGNTTEQVRAGDDSTKVSVLFGNVTVVVPEGTRVDTSGLLPFGNTECLAACGPASSGEDVVDVRAIGAFGNVEVLTAQEYEDRQERERAEELREEREERREELREELEDQRDD